MRARRNALLRRPQFGLHSLTEDPNEIRPLADRSEYLALGNDLVARIRQTQEQTGNPWLSKWVFEQEEAPARGLALPRSRVGIEDNLRRAPQRRSERAIARGTYSLLWRRRGDT
jgi:hypothetical protein